MNEPISRPQFYSCRVPSLGRRTTIPASNERRAIAAMARLWKVATHRVVVVFSYPASLEQEGA